MVLLYLKVGKYNRNKCQKHKCNFANGFLESHFLENAFLRYFASLDMTKEYKCLAQSHLSKVPKHDDAILYIVL